MISISDHIKKLPVDELEKWISDREKENRSDEWRKELAKLKRRVKRISAKSKGD